MHVDALHDELVKRDFECEVVKLPYKWYPREEILKHAFVWRLLDLSESNLRKIDLVIGTKFPSYYVRHPNKVTWLIHQFRQVYDLYGTEHCDFSDKNDIDRSIKERIETMDRITLLESKRIFTNSKNTALRLKKFNQIDSEPLYHPPKLIGQYKYEAMGDYILSVGRLDRLKRIDMLITSMRFVDRRVKCVIAGTGPEDQALRKLVARYGLESRVSLAGFVSDEELIKLYANCFAVYYAPFDEDYGYVTLEAFLSRKPVVTTVDAGGVLEFVKHRENGAICRLDPQEIGKAIDGLFSNKERARDYGIVGYDLVKDIGWDNVIERLTDAIAHP